jgi:hypothetical protein
MEVSLSNPHILITNTGEVYLKETGEKCTVIDNHAYSTRGPVAQVRQGRGFRYYSVAKLVYENFVKKEKLTNTDYYAFKDGNESNVHYTNLVETDRKFNSKYRNHTIKNYKKSDVYEGCWMGGDSIYI